MTPKPLPDHGDNFVTVYGNGCWLKGEPLPARLAEWIAGQQKIDQQTRRNTRLKEMGLDED